MQNNSGVILHLFCMLCFDVIANTETTADDERMNTHCRFPYSHYYTAVPSRTWLKSESALIESQSETYFWFKNCFVFCKVHLVNEINSFDQLRCGDALTRKRFALHGAQPSDQLTGRDWFKGSKPDEISAERSGWTTRWRFRRWEMLTFYQWLIRDERLKTAFIPATGEGFRRTTHRVFHCGEVCLMSVNNKEYSFSWTWCVWNTF